MEPFSIKKIPSSHRIIILEGFWGAGKSTIAYSLRDEINGIIIPEPACSDRKIHNSDISAWYVARYGREWKKVLHILKRGQQSVICERSILSSAAFEYASKGCLSETMKKRVRQISSCRSAIIIYLKSTRMLISRGIACLRDVSVLRQLHKKANFVSEYHKFFYKILPHDFNMRNILYIKTSDRLLKRLRKRIHEVSAAGVVIHGSKVVVLYDKKYKHFVLPQGHCNIGESLVQTAKREITEETGYVDMMYLKKLYVYQYHFPRANQTVFKTIHVYLFKSRSTKRKPRILEAHEMYEARLIPIRRAITILHWPQDRLVIKKAMREIKKGPVR